MDVTKFVVVLVGATSLVSAGCCCNQPGGWGSPGGTTYAAPPPTTYQSYPGAVPPPPVTTPMTPGQPVTTVPLSQTSPTGRTVTPTSYTAAGTTTANSAPSYY